MSADETKSASIRAIRGSRIRTETKGARKVCSIRLKSAGMAGMDIPLEVDVATAARLQREGALLLDVREPIEVATCAVAGSTHIPMRQIPEALANLPRDRPLLVLCHHGGRSLRVAQFLRANGFTQVSNVSGGIEAWSQQIDPTIPRY